MLKVRLTFYPFLVWMLLLLTSCNIKNRETLRVFIAGSLVVPFKQLEEAYEKQHPEVDLQVEAHGSIQVIRHVTEIHDLIDVVVPADYRLIPMLMYPSLVPETGESYADWSLQFANNRLVLAYTPDSRYSDEISTENWFEILSRPDVKCGLSDPRFDAAGYRSLMVVQLAEDYYYDPSIFESIYLGRFKIPIIVQKDGDQRVIQVPELLETTPKSNIVMRGGSIALLALLDSGDIDYAFEYESVAHQHGLSFIELPPELNLGDPAFGTWYEKVSVRLDFQRFTSITPEFKGELITYGLTIPSNAPNPQIAQDFVMFLLSSEGRRIMESNNHPLFSTYWADDPGKLPDPLLPLLP